MKTTHNVPLKALCLTLGVHFKGTHARQYKKIVIYFVFCSLIRTFAADFKGCLRVQAEMIPSNLIQMILA